ncbi:MAG: UUP1 family membrane protein [Desulfobacterales bacterium]|uniref:UUP1 family membrane protein n=1 Tax=Candidatus Desulfatibia vada TaxID=2841696 RepID=A0A8J6P068_9BACT|nr:UUP1 family membrane protein [Candidatus Desulfatibia vada]MBL6971220.1 UUP1 family membrane protein [Desulfobacterales bacterium]
MNNRHLYLLVGGLTSVGLALFLYKALFFDFPLVPETQSKVWNIEARLTFTARNAPVKVTMFIPRNSRRFAILNESFTSRGYGVSIAAENGKRRATWSIRKANGSQNLYYRASVLRVDKKEQTTQPATMVLEHPELQGAHLEASKALISEVHQKSADTDSMVIGLLQRINNAQPDENVALLLGKTASLRKRVDLAVQLLALAGIHARTVHGIRLEGQQREVSIMHWLEVYDNEKWVSYEPVAEERGIPEDYLGWWRGMEPLVQSKGAERLDVLFSVSRSEEAAIQSAMERSRIKKPFVLEFSLFSLPLQTQAVYHVILIMPVGVFLLVILRNVIGLRTFGTFMPVLIALSFRETQLLWGVFLFTSIVAMGLSIRLYLEQLKLLVVPRLAAILIIVIFLMAVFSILTNKLGMERGLSVALFPMIIITMTIERMSVVWEELGAYETLRLGAGSLIAAVIAYWVMSIKYIEHLVFVFPELLLVILSITLLLGRYTGYRLLELQRFKSLAVTKSDV